MIKPRLIRQIVRIIISLVLLPAYGYPAHAQATPEPPAVTIHIIQDSETLESIAASYGTSIEAIEQANSLKDPRDIFVGQRLIIPITGTSAAIPGTQTTIIVGLAETLTSLASCYDTTLENLGRLNRVVNPSQLYAGQIIAVPSTMSAGTVRLGKEDSFWGVALRANTNIVALATINHITNPFIVAPGSIIRFHEETSLATMSQPPWESIVLHPLPLEQGRTGGLRLTTTIPGTVEASFLSRDLQVVSTDTDHEAVFGIDRWTAPGLYPLTISLEDESGTIWTYNKDVLIVDGEYTREEIRVSEETSAVLDNSQEVQEEADYIRQKMSGFTPERHWEGLFKLPVAGVLTSPFGSLRTYKGYDTVTFHTGTDLAIKTGTPFSAPANGIVIDTGWLDIRGYITLIDHGAGVYTGYWHQAAILVKPGDKVTAGQEIGTVGSTGLSTASHLHWEMWVDGVQVDPMQWVREIFP
ncbi:MAG: peptidoglycan DD-metalloendopeptidase family protein [Anaerolineae bacterium]|nr:peptidoglycan DD-metalloendopeptidase family protein [Anaerolineae bacterium]